MKMPLKFLDKKEAVDYYLALILRNEKAIAVVFEKSGPEIKYINADEEYFENTIEDADIEQLLSVLDKVITKAESPLPDNIETHKTLFGLKESWIENNKIKKEYLDKLKKISDELVLDPIGFLEFRESIINLIQKDEGAPLSAIFVDIGKKFVTVSLVRSGKILETKTSEIHETASFTVDALLKHLQTPEALPSRIIILDSEEEELTQEFMAHQWSKSIYFLHIPQISNLPEDTAVKAMLLGASTQMGANLLYDSTKSLDLDEEPKKIEPEVIPQSTPIETPDLTSEVGANSLEFFGFLENEDITKVPIPEEKAAEKIPDNVIRENIEEIPEEKKIEEEQETPVPVNASLVTVKIKKFVASLPKIFAKIKFKDFLSVANLGNLRNGKLIAIPIVIVILLLGLLYFYIFAKKAEVTILVAPKSDQKTAQVTFSPSSSTDVKNSVIASEFISVTEDGSLTAPATGKKDVGNPAKGNVTIFNNNDSSVSFNSGTTIKSSNGLEFTLDKSVSVASASGDIFSGTTPGTASVAVTASDIGQEYNLPSGTKFAIGSSTTVAAKNDTAFSGGTKKQVTVVSNDDLNKLLSTLPKNLEQKANSDIKSKVSEGKSILPQFISEVVTDKSFDKKANDQASQVTLKGTVEFQAAAYSNSDMFDLASSIFASSDQSLSKENFEVSAKNISVEKNKDASADLTIKVNLLPKMDTESIKKQITGVPLLKAQNMLSNFPQVESVNISLHPNIPFLPKSLPGNPQSIKVTISLH